MEASSDNIDDVALDSVVYVVINYNNGNRFQIDLKNPNNFQFVNRISFFVIIPNFIQIIN